MFQVRAQEEPSGTSHTHLFILFPLNNRTSDKELKPCVFSNKAYREGVRGAKKTVCSHRAALLDLSRDGSVTR